MEEVEEGRKGLEGEKRKEGCERGEEEKERVLEER